MTAQSMEILYLYGKRHYMASEPFNAYLETLDEPPKLFSPNTACWRGYYGRWEIIDDRLFLSGLEANIDVDGKVKEAGLDYFFPDQKVIFADWFSGELRVPMGKMVEYVHMGYHSKYEKDMIIIVEKGIILSRTEIHNI